MNLDILKLILRKEVRSALRNRSLMLLILLIPLVIFPLFILVPPILANPSLSPSSVLVVNLDNGAQGANLTRQISQTQGLGVTMGDRNSSAQAAVQSGLYDAAIIIPQNFSVVIQKNQTATLQLFYDSTYSRSAIALGLLNAAILSYSQQIVILKNSGRAGLVPIGIAPTPVTGVRPLIAVVGHLFPLLWVGWASLSGAYLGLDMTADEEGASTLVSLLVSPNSRSEILGGKSLAVIVVAIFLALLTIAGIYLIPTLGVLIGSGFKEFTVSSSIPLTSGMIVIMAIGVALSFSLAGLLLQYLGLFFTGAGRVRVGLASVIGSLGSAAFLFSTSKLNIGFITSLLPPLGAYTMLNRAVLGIATASDVGLVGGVGLLSGLLLVLLTDRQLKGEGLLLRSVFAYRGETAEETPVSKQPPPPSTETM